MLSKKRLLTYLLTVFIVAIIAGYLLGSYLPLGKLLNIGKKDFVLVDKERDLYSQEVEKGSDSNDKYDQCDLHFEVAGAVNYPGVYCLGEDSLINDALNKAGGLNKLSAKRYISQKINLSQSIVDGQKIYIPFEDDLMCEKVKFLLDNSLDRYLNGEDDGSSTCISINFASAKELDALQGVGEATAEKIVENRPYKVLSDLLENKVVSEKVFNDIQSSICL